MPAFAEINWSDMVLCFYVSELNMKEIAFGSPGTKKSTYGWPERVRITVYGKSFVLV